MTAYIAAFDGKVYYGSYINHMIVFRRKPMEINREYTAGKFTFSIIWGQSAREVYLLRKDEQNRVSADAAFSLNSLVSYYADEYGLRRFRMFGKHELDMQETTKALRNRFNEYDGDFIPLDRYRNIGKRPWFPCILKQGVSESVNMEIVKRLRLNYSAEAIMAELKVDKSVVSNLWRLHVAD